MKKIAALILAITILLGCCPFTTLAETQPSSQAQSSYGNTTASGSNDAGDLLADVINEALEEKANEDVTNRIFSVEFEGNIATVTFSNTVKARIIVAIYAEDGTTMITSQTADVEENAESVEITFDASAMPEYFFVRAFLLDRQNKPLHSSFESDHYTKAFIDFINTTTEDFDQEQILNFDESTDNNFAVFGDDTTIVDAGEYNQLISNDETTHTVVFDNIDEKISSLKVGDIFYHQYGEGENEYLIIKVKTIAFSGKKATIVADESITLEEVFSLVKIDTVGHGKDAEIDPSSADEGVSYEEIPTTYASPRSSNLVDLTLSPLPYVIKFEKAFKNSDDESLESTSITFSGSYAFSAKVKLKVYYYETNHVIVDLTLETEAKLSVSVKGKVFTPEDGFNLGGFNIPLAGGTKVRIDIFLLFSFEGSLEFNGTLTSTLNYKYSAKDKKIIDKSNDSKFLDTDIEPKVKFFMGFKFKPAISDALTIVEVYGEAIIGVEATVNQKNQEMTNTEQHACKNCVEIKCEVVFKAKFGTKIQLWIFKNKYEVDLFNLKLSPFKYYYSSDLGFGQGECPNSIYKIRFQAFDTLGFPLSNVDIDRHITNADGITEGWYRSGNYSLSISINGENYPSYDFTVKDSSTELITLHTTDTAGVKTGSCGGDVNYSLFPNGKLVIYGQGPVETWVFANNPNITSVEIGKGITAISNNMFHSCKNLKKVTIAEGVTEIGIDAFHGCSSLKEVHLPESVISIQDWAFASNTSLETIVLPKNLTYLGYYAFYSCSSLKSISIPDKITRLNGGTFDSCSSLQKVNLPNSLTFIDWEVFKRCSSLESIAIPNGVTAMGVTVFGDCVNLKNITLPDSLKEIPSMIFYNCTGLTSITIPSSVTNISWEVFYNCKNLTTITIPKSVKSIGWDSFYGCNNLSRVKYKGTSADWRNINISGGNECLKNATLIDSNLFPFEPINSYNSALPVLNTPIVNYNSSSVTEESSLGYTEITVDDLVPGEIYALVVFAGLDYIDFPDSNALLYIIDGIADENGVATFTCYFDSSVLYTTECFGKCNHKEGDSVEAICPTVHKEGQSVKLCTKCSEILISESIACLLLGDADGDRIITANDLVYLRKVLLNADFVAENYYGACDVTEDSSVNIKDLIRMKKYLLKLIDQLGA